MRFTPCHPHRLEDILREVGTFPEIDVRLRHRLGDVGIGGKVEDCLAAGHRRRRQTGPSDHAARFRDADRPR